MKTLVEKIQLESPKVEKGFEDDEHFQDLKEFQKNIKRLGLESQQTYSLPPLDTIGKRLYQSEPSSQNDIKKSAPR